MKNKYLLLIIFLMSTTVNHSFALDKKIAKEIEEQAKYIHSDVNPVFNVSCSMDGKIYSGANETKTITIRDTESGKIIRKITRNSNIRAIEFDPSSKLAIIGFFNGDIEVWSIDSGKLLKEINSLGGPISDIEYSSDGKYLVVAGGTGNYSGVGIKVYDAKSFKEKYFINKVATYDSISIDHDSNIFAVSTWSGIFIYELSSGSLIDKLGDEYSYFDISLSNNAEVITFNQFIKSKSYAVVLNLKSRKVLLSLKTGIAVGGVIISNDGSMLFVGGDDGVVGILDMESRSWLSHATTKGGTIKSMRLCGNRHLITGHWHNSVNVIDIFNGKVIRSHSGG